MRLEKISFKKFRLFDDLKIEFPKENFIVLLGNNGGGKTTILEGISNCLEHFIGKLISDKESHSIERTLLTDDIKEGNDRTELETTVDFESSLMTFWIAKNKNIQGSEYKIDQEDILKKVSEEIKQGNRKSVPVFYYYTIKRADYPGRTYNATNNIKNNVLDTYERQKRISNIANFEDWFVAESIDESILKNNDKSYESNSLRSCREVLNKFLQYFDFEIKSFKLLKKEGQRFVPNSNLEYYFGVEKNGTSLTFNQLSSGEKAIIHLITDIARRLSIANSHSENSLSGNGIVLIDEIDLHMHPSWQLQITDALRKVFPNVQFIVTTHSPLVLSAVRKSEIITLTSEGPMPNEEIANIFGATADEILQKLLFSDIQNAEFDEERKKVDKLIRLGRFDEASEEIKKLKLQVPGSPKWLLDYERRVAFEKA